MKDQRKSFKEAVSSFRNFAEQEGKPRNLAWITKDRVQIGWDRLWIYRPKELARNEHAQRFYSKILESDSSVKLLGINELGSYYIASIEEMPSPEHTPFQLYMSLSVRPEIPVGMVSSRLVWFFLRLAPNSPKLKRFILDAISLPRIIEEA